MGTFDFDGEKYKAASMHQKEWGGKIISELKLHGTEAILDLGCGDGVLTAHLASLVPAGSTLGIDASKGMITTAKKQKMPNLRFKIMDINDINFSEGFDLVFSNATLHWIHDHTALLRNVYDALKPGGMIRFNFAGYGNCVNFEQVARDLMQDPWYERYFSDFTWPWFTPAAQEYESLVNKSRFQEIRVWPENADRFFSSAEDMVRWIDQPSLVPFLKHINAGDSNLFRDEFVARMIKLTQQEDGRCFETFRRINVFAKK